MHRIISILLAIVAVMSLAIDVHGTTLYLDKNGENTSIGTDFVQFNDLNLPKIRMPIRDGYTFYGYFGVFFIDNGTSITSKELCYYNQYGEAIRSWWNANEILSKEPYTLYAKWIPKNSYNNCKAGDPIVVDFDKQGGIGGTSSVHVRFMENLPSIDVPTREGCKFYGYYNYKEGEGDALTQVRVYDEFGAPLKVAFERKLYAHWSPVRSTLYVDGELFMVQYGMPMPSITVPTRYGYTFGGYWTGENGSGVQYYTASGKGARRMWNRTDDYLELISIP